MVKNYVLDTNVLIYDPKSIFQFQDNKIWIPIFVLEEIDKFKNEQSQRGHAAREVTRQLDDLRYQGSLSEGIKLENGGILTIAVPKENPKLSVAITDQIDHAILQTAININENDLNAKTILVTMDINLRVRAESLKIQTATYENNRVNLSDLDNNVIELQTDLINEFYKNRIIDKNKLGVDLKQNQCILMKSGSQSALGRVVGKTVQGLKPGLEKGCYGIKPRNVEQHFALDLLLDNKIQLVTIMGKSGCGKTLLAILAGISGILDGSYNKMLVGRPIVPLGGKDLGYLPGDVNEKLRPWMKPIYDNLDFILMSGGKKLQDIENMIEIEALTYIRGRSIPYQFILIDEAQNLSPHEIKTIVTRCGEGTKLVFTGDPYQIDNPYMDCGSNGLSYLAKKIVDNSMVGHLQLHKGERSPLATLAAEVL